MRYFFCQDSYVQCRWSALFLRTSPASLRGLQRILSDIAARSENSKPLSTAMIDILIRQTFIFILGVESDRWESRSIHNSRYCICTLIIFSLSKIGIRKQIAQGTTFRLFIFVFHHSFHFLALVHRSHWRSTSPSEPLVHISILRWSKWYGDSCVQIRHVYVFITSRKFIMLSSCAQHWLSYY